ncbi:Lrp/AsnC family transcriptional regulator [Natrinema salaciae]|uniref:DNA-binding transcriptional regulator, Lrp family n=1 Tax=Natrinema salaciae TaxID=1186196 RepID=A0A1H9CF93_9EURY|nr:Lrp/AsnC family transcriptional regulator [Natrinema salaciae]SEP99832.1 DNA-binding transcriptional regulator, Lrp family [Natrinema salaciae]
MKGCGTTKSTVTAYQLDDVDRQLLDLLQENARYKAIELAEEIGVSDNTVHNRMDRLEEAGVITGYAASVDHGRTGLDLTFHFSCTARIGKRATVAEEAMAFPQVVEVTELMTGQENLHIKAVGAEHEDITHVAEQLDELALDINDENLVRTERRKSVDYEAVSSLLDRKQ